jgi:hypothetical protein
VQLILLLPQQSRDGQWLFWPIHDKEMTGCLSALAYLKTQKERYVIAGVGNQVMMSRSTVAVAVSLTTLILVRVCRFLRFSGRKRPRAAWSCSRS